MNVANVQVLPVSHWQFPIRAAWQIGNINTAPHAPKRRHEAQCKRVRSEGCFAAHLLSVHCAGFARMVRRNGLELSERVNECGDRHDMDSVGAGVGGGASADGGKWSEGLGVLYAWC